ncbi:asparagine synthetase B family protein [Nocardia panacis]|uniref:asparagine synthase (glutamine-hydrolyzing) n=1 Tax=Nocardia panacis TaxID=2340916 RepID=A0A3A4K184_9NOCA|nr:asparagine synthase-related protein [Nocardia panacis]RJO78013.1 asparagine synthetase B family protein [Nocardia panacis]
MSWFAALPDNAAGRDMVARFPDSARRIAAHGSGLPWLIGSLPPEQCTIVESGSARLAVLGYCPSTAVALAEQLVRIRGLADLDALAGALRGSCHLVLSLDGNTRVQGTVSGLRRVFYARCAGRVVAADRADVLAGATSAEPDELWLTAAVLGPDLPHPLADRTAWRGIEAVPADSALHLDARGQARLRRWWTPPEPTLSSADGAQALRTELRDAVAARTRRASAPVGCDLSGGMDSTALCFLASRGDPVAVTVHYRDIANDDAHWADLAATALPDLQRLIVESESVPRHFTGIAGEHPPTDAPSPLVRGRAVLGMSADLYARRGVRTHLAGHGGDEVVGAPVGYLHELVRRSPRTALDHLRGHRARHRWTLPQIVRGLSDRRSYAQWLRDEADLLTAPEQASRLFGWGVPLRLPPWVTLHGTQSVAAMLRACADHAAPLASTRGNHWALHRIQAAGRLYRLMLQEIQYPITHLPFLDDRVLEVCLAVRPADRGTPWRYKPLLAEAMRGIVPDPMLNRTTKAGTDSDFYEGLRANRSEVIDLVETAPLAGQGLIDPIALRNAVLAPNHRWSPALEDTLICLGWRPRIPITTTP